MGFTSHVGRLAAGMVLIWHLGLQGCDILEEIGLGLQSVFRVPFDSLDRGWEPFVMNGTQYVALASETLDSMLYELDAASFQEVQRLGGDIGNRVFDVEYFEIGGASYLALASSQGVESKICRWEGSQFVEYQIVPLQDHRIKVTDLEDFMIDGVSYLGAAMAESPSYVFKWNGAAFEEFQMIPTRHDARAMKSFNMEGTKYLAIAAHEGPISRSKDGVPQWVTELTDNLNQYFRNSRRKRGETINSYDYPFFSSSAFQQTLELDFGGRGCNGGGGNGGGGSPEQEEPEDPWRSWRLLGQLTVPMEQPAMAEQRLELGLQHAMVQRGPDIMGLKQQRELESAHGWYLLQDAGLTAGERNMIYTALKGEFSMNRVAQELRNQWPEHEIKRHDQQHRASGFLGQVDEISDDEEDTNVSFQDQELSEEGQALLAEHEDQAAEALAVIQRAKKTLKEAAQHPHLEEVLSQRAFFIIGRTKYGNLQAEAVDVLEVAGQCDPLTCLDEHVRNVICNDNLMFSEAPSGMSSFEGIPAEERNEYVKLVARQLCSKQLALAAHAKGGGAIIAVSKPGGKRQRAVWHGKRVSAAAMRPPNPRHLASPTVLSLMECPAGQKIRCSKRDASCWFDQLQLPAAMQRWMGRPSVTARELCTVGGLLTWPMGFAWSSFVAQEFLLDTCSAAGLTERQILSSDVQTPTSCDVVFAAATDDVMIFSASGAGHSLKAAKQLDGVFEQRGIVRNSCKDVDDSLSAACVGVVLEDGTHLAVPPARFTNSYVFSSGTICYTAASWLSMIRCTYEFVRDETDTVVKTVPNLVLFELCAAVFLGIFWRQDLQRPFLPLLSATDASTEYGFGASIARVPVPMIRRLARVAEKQGAYVVMDGGFSPEAAAKRLGQLHKLDISLDDFTDIFSIKSKHEAHINVLEGEAFIIWLRWILRSRKRRCTRVVVLVDSAVWLGAAAKGRSSTQLNRLLRKAAALELAGGVQVHLILVPSAENPSDRPSRGVRLKTAKFSRGSCTAPWSSRQ
ncbi:Lgi2 [Symbiodinium sp. KB8]|nr:Lgi2 [Symbiodinium sp. KB8]